MNPGTLTIANESLTARFRPELGGRVTHLIHASRGNILVPLTHATFNAETWPKCGAFPLFPYHNRINGAEFTFQGRTIRLRPQKEYGQDTMHGPAQRHAWVAVPGGPSTITLRHDHIADEDWPWNFSASQHFALIGDSMHIALCLTNTSQRDMPGGMGWHPYFALPRPARMALDARNQWLSRSEVPKTQRLTKTVERMLDGSVTTEFYSDWRSAKIQFDDGSGLVVSADTGLPHLVFHMRGSYACLEPASHTAGALQLPPEHQHAAGPATLRPGEALRAKVALTIR